MPSHEDSPARKLAEIVRITDSLILHGADGPMGKMVEMVED